MQAGLETHGDFKMLEDGSLDFESLKVLRVVSMRQGNRDFDKNHRPKLMERRLEAYKK